MRSDDKRISEVMTHIQAIKAGSYPVVVGQAPQYRIEERPWQDMPDRNKLAILQGAVDWTGVTNRDQAHILLSEVDPGRIGDVDRNRLIDSAVGRGNQVDSAAERVRYAVTHKDQGKER